MATNRSWLPACLAAAIAYPLIGIAFGALPFATHPLQIAARLSAWLLSGAVFLVHLRYEAGTRGSASWTAALRVAIAVALGGFLLAIWVNVHAHLEGATQARPHALLALVLFPLLTGAPAFVAAFALVAAARRFRSRRSV
jgi:hypothetical protein